MTSELVIRNQQVVTEANAGYRRVGGPKWRGSGVGGHFEEGGDDVSDVQ